MGAFLAHDEIPQGEPTQVRAGDTWRWRRRVPGHAPSDGWALTYALRRGDVVRTVTTTTDDDDFVAHVTAVVSAGLDGGPYDLVGRVSRTDQLSGEKEVHTVYVGRLDVLANPVAPHLTHAEKMVAKLECAIEERIEGSAAGALRRWREGNVEEEYSEDLKGLLAQLGYYYDKVRQERGGAAIQTLRGAFVHPA